LTTDSSWFSFPDIATYDEMQFSMKIEFDASDLEAREVHSTFEESEA
jgi:hypothetical protein